MHAMGAHEDGGGRLATSAPEFVALLRRGSAEAVFAAISQGDPLGLAERSTRRQRERAFLLDTDRVFERALLRTAFAADTWRDGEPLEPWLVQRVDEAIDDLLLQDESEHRQSPTLSDEWDERYVFIIYLLGIEPRFARRACVGFNGLGAPARRAFFALLIEERSVDECVAAGHGPRERLLITVRSTFAVLFGVPAPPPKRGSRG